MLDLLADVTPRTSSLVAMLAAFLASGTVAGTVMVAMAVPLRLFTRVRRPVTRRRLVAAYVGALVFLAGHYALRTPALVAGTRAWRYTLLLSFLAVTASVVAWLAAAHVRSPARRRRPLPWVPCALAGCAAIAVDRLVLVSLYERAHSVVEAVGCIAMTVAVAALLNRRCARRLVTGAAVAMLAWVLVLSASKHARAALDAALPDNAEGRRIYLSRVVRRLRVLERIADKGSVSGDPAGAHHLTKRYELHDTRLDEAWRARVARPVIPDDSRPWNVVFFFVDALRADVAFDEATMPETARWMREHVSFSRAYAPASSTLQSLPPLLGCRYDVSPTEPPALLRVAQERGMKSALFIPREAADYHQAFFPTFRFDHQDVIEDRRGTVLLTGNTLVDHALTWLKDEGSRPFFLWLYDFDVHEWIHFPDRPMEEIADEAQLSKTEGLPWRYRAAARAVDRSFARLRNGLRDLGLLDHTVIVFLADHGEGLGEHGQWWHSTYLWETLVRVPLAVEAHGLPPQRIDAPVSLIDVPTTLARFIGPVPDDDRCHGEDLLTDRTSGRRLPILLSAMLDGTLVQLGLLESAERKLVVDLREGQAHLYDLAGAEESSINAPAEGVRLLDRLVRSPLFPRP
ncbi:MAG: sulfatase-like hydrolase/transferase [Labilithrix sp.]|nr:sulfatase-like hydrolase/transferase [Labilithrix sp.]MCW5812515.1 sulfatase-like hydrolase/transferase [Labilithrix sp.]